MAFAFEVRETDLQGRIGTLKIGSKSLETPYMFPVIHPVSQGVSTDELKAMGFGGLMTNSYIIRSRRKDEALRDGIHKVLDFDGMFMTDSGGYQVLEYGDLGVTYSEVASFQAAIGSEAAVTLDRPTGYPQKREVAEQTVEYSLENAKATLAEFGGSQTIWVGPIQGGLYEDLVRKSATSLVNAGFSFLALGSPVQVMQNYMFSDLVRMITAAKKSMPYSVPLHLFGAGHPLTMALAIALGCDTFDSASYVLFARSGRYMTRGGVLTLNDMSYLPCSCRVCTKETVSDLLEQTHEERTRALSIHNLHIMREELEGCKEAISEGKLWDLVEERSIAHPMLRMAFGEFVKLAPWLAEGTPAQKDHGVLVRGEEDRLRPEFLTAAKRLGRSTRRSSGTAYLTKPGESIQKKGKASPGDVYKMNQVLGLYPAELEFVYPFAQTVTATDDISDDAVKKAARKLRASGYRRVVTSGGQTRKVRSRRSRRASSPSPR